jgi:hypothetical protein
VISLGFVLDGTGRGESLQITILWCLGRTHLFLFISISPPFPPFQLCISYRLERQVKGSGVAIMVEMQNKKKIFIIK